MMDGRQNGGGDGLGSTRDMLVDSLNASDREMKVEIVRESVFVPQEDMKHLDTRKVIPDGWRLQGSAEELSKPTNGMNVGWKWYAMEIHTKPEVAPELCPEIGVGALGKSSQTSGRYIAHETLEFLLP